jgi:UDP-N-acetylmuramoyl-tripeptide--D-alanyl-D-alanine ligase
MPELTVNEILEVTNGNLDTPRGNMIFSNFHFDTRRIRDERTLFFALKSDHNDGHNYIDRIMDRKGCGAVVSKEFRGGRPGFPLIRVDDPLKSAHMLASHIRKKHNSIKYIGITGSAGKTTTKEFLYQILSTKYHAFRSIENWNNWIGMPFSMLAMKGDEQAAVFELAMSYPGIGEIDCLAEMLKPDLALILNVFPVHLEFLKNLENVARGKAEILNYMSSDSTAFITGDSDAILSQSKSRPGRKIYFGRRHQSNEILLKGTERTKRGFRLIIDFYGIEADFFAPVVNKTQIENVFAAIVVSQSMGLKNEEIQSALEKIKPLPGRGDIKQYSGFTVIDETYNSNPEALKKTLKWIDEEYRETKIAVVGDMLELGENEDQYHFQAGQFFATLNFNHLVVVGERSKQIARGAKEAGFNPDRIKWCEAPGEAGVYLKEIVNSPSIILLKASRGIALEKALEELRHD